MWGAQEAVGKKRRGGRRKLLHLRPLGLLNAFLSLVVHLFLLAFLADNNCNKKKRQAAGAAFEAAKEVKKVQEVILTSIV